VSLVDLFNRALGANGVSAGIVDPEENSREAALCRQWFPFVRDMVMGAAPWPSLKAYSRLALAKTKAGSAWGTSDPAPSFSYAFAQPLGMIRPRHLQSFGRFEWSGGLIHTSEPAPILFYTQKLEDISLWDQDLNTAITYALAAQIAVQATGRSTRLQENMQIAQLRIDDAKVAAANAEHIPYETMPEWFQVRNTGILPIDPFLYPTGALNIGAVG